MTETKPDPTQRLLALAAAATTEDDARAIAMAIRELAREHAARNFQPYPWQHPHRHPGEREHGPDCPDGCRNPHVPVCTPACATAPAIEPVTHAMWLQLGGRGTGKTESAARYVNAHVTGPPCDDRLPGGHRVLIVAPTQGDGAESCYRGPSGMRVVNPRTRLIGSTGGLRIMWPSGASARVLGAYGPEDVERLRAAGNTCLVWMEELAAQRHLADALTHTSMGLRIGPTPHYVGSTTPKPRPELRALIADPATVITKGKTRDAVRLDPSVLDSYLRKYEGTRQGRQELDAELLDDVEGALWSLSAIDLDRHRGPMPTLDVTVVAVDPPGGQTEAGIVVAGRKGDEGFVFADLSGKMSPEQWGREAVNAYWRYGAAAIAVETAYGGEMVLATIRTIDPTIPIAKMPTKVGKRLRAEPVVALYEQHRIHHVGLLPALESQMTEWVPGETTDSPDRLDALVHALTYLLVRGGAATAGAATGIRITGPRRGAPTSVTGSNPFRR